MAYTCNQVKDCPNAVTHADSKWLYCTQHATRGNYRPVRKLKPWEIQRLNAGKTIPSRSMSKTEFARIYPDQAEGENNGQA
jgi:hypothetical protein